MTYPNDLRSLLITKGWVDDFNADTLVRLVERYYGHRQPPAPPTLTPQQQEAMDALDHILKHSTTNLGEATIRKAILGGEA